MTDSDAINPAIAKLVAFAEGGADCLFAPGVAKADSPRWSALSPEPLNVVMMRPGLSVAELADLGVRRISVGGALARVAWGAVMAAAEQIKVGSFDGLATGTPGSS